MCRANVDDDAVEREGSFGDRAGAVLLGTLCCYEGREDVSIFVEL